MLYATIIKRYLMLNTLQTLIQMNIISLPCVLFVCAALKWYRAKCNIQAEIEEMQEEQRSLSSVDTVSVWQLILDHTVRWQVLSVVVINIGMQLSGIDAVRLTSWLKYWIDCTACFMKGLLYVLAICNGNVKNSLEFFNP